MNKIHDSKKLINNYKKLITKICVHKVLLLSVPETDLYVWVISACREQTEGALSGGRVIGTRHQHTT